MNEKLKNIILITIVRLEIVYTLNTAAHTACPFKRNFSSPRFVIEVLIDKWRVAKERERERGRRGWNSYAVFMKHRYLSRGTLRVLFYFHRVPFLLSSAAVSLKRTFSALFNRGQSALSRQYHCAGINRDWKSSISLLT